MENVNLNSIIESMVSDQVAEAVAEGIALMMPEIMKQAGNGIVKELVIKGIKPEEIKVETPHPMLPEVLIGFQHSNASYRNVYAYGPAGSGKSTLGKQAAEVLGVPWVTQGCLTSKFEISGFTDANGTYQESLLYTWLKQEQGAVLILEEFDRGIAGAIVQLNEILANGTYTFANGETLNRTETHYVFANGNTNLGGRDRNYSSAQIIDASTKDRFAVIYCGYDENFEISISPNPDWTRRVQKIRRAVEALKLDLIVTPRASIGGADWIAQGASQERVEDVWVFRGCSDDVKKKVISSVGKASTASNGRIINNVIEENE